MINRINKSQRNKAKSMKKLMDWSLCLKKIKKLCKLGKIFKDGLGSTNRSLWLSVLGGRIRIGSGGIKLILLSVRILCLLSTRIFRLLAMNYLHGLPIVVYWKKNKKKNIRFSIYCRCLRLQAGQTKSQKKLLQPRPLKNLNQTLNQP